MTWNVVIDGEEEIVPGVDALRSWLTDGRITPNSHMFHAISGKWMCVRDAPELSDLCPANETLFDLYREQYSRALLAIDYEVPVLVRRGKDLGAIEVFSANKTIIRSIHEQLQSFYLTIHAHLPLLAKFGSPRLAQLERSPIEIRELRKDSATPEMVQKFVNEELVEAGYRRTHPHLEMIVLREIDYMLDVLQQLVEPDYVPLESLSVAVSDEVQIDPQSDIDPGDRYIARSVKLYVWRRDEGRCVQCKSRELLEYDHVIPFSKGGSNTERNIQLLCEKCNRSKSAEI